MALHIDREEIKPGRRSRLGQDVVERANRHTDHPLRLGTRRHALAVKGGQSTGNVKLHLAASVLGRGAGVGKYIGRTHPPQIRGEFRLRLDQDTGPSSLFEMPTLRPVARLIGTDLHEETMPVREKFAHQLLLASVRGYYCHSPGLNGLA